MFNFFLKAKQDEQRQNTLADVKTNTKDKVDTFIKFAKSTQETRAKDFDILLRFVLQNEQWTNSELDLKDDEHESALVFNFSQEYLERYLARLFPRNPHTGVLEIGAKVREQSPEKASQYESQIFDIYYQYDLANIIIEQGTNFLCGGAAVLYYPQDIITKKAFLMSLDPAKCYLGWKNGRLVQFAYKEYQSDGKYKINYHDIFEHIVVDELNDKVITVKNEYNFVPVSWIPNNPRPHQHEGVSKIRLLADLDRAYNRTSSNFDKRIEENTEPHIVLKSDMADPEKIHRGRKKLTKIGTHDDMNYLELKEGKEIMDWLNLIEKRITTKTGIVHSAGQTKTNVSGKSLSYQYSDMMDLIGFMRLRWDKAFRDMNAAILTYANGKNKYQTDPVYHPFLMQDNAERIEEYALMIENKLISIKDAIDELRGVDNAEEKLKEILAEMKMIRSNEEPEPAEKKEKKSFN